MIISKEPQREKSANAPAPSIKSASKEEAKLKNADFYFRQGNSYDTQGQFDQAIVAYSKAIEINPNFDLALNNLAWYYAQKGENLDEALELAKRAVELAPIASYLDTLGYVHYKRGEYQEAEKQILRALELEPENEEYQNHLEEIRSAKILNTSTLKTK